MFFALKKERNSLYFFLALKINATSLFFSAKNIIIVYYYWILHSEQNKIKSL